MSSRASRCRAFAQGAFLQAGMSYGVMKQLKLSPQMPRDASGSAEQPDVADRAEPGDSTE